MHVYLAGPMRGKPLFNFAEFMRVAMELRDDGHTVLNPAERDLAVGFNPALPIEHPENAAVFTLGAAFEWDFAAIVSADAIVLLEGWRESNGTQAELVLAMSLGRKVFEYVNDTLHESDVRSYTITFDDGE